MPNLKDLKNRISSVKSTRKITSAMKMVAASKFRRAQDRAESSRPYAKRMSQILGNLLSQTHYNDDEAPLLLKGTGKEDTILLIIMTSDRGLCGGFNTTVIREARRQIADLEKAGKTVKLACIGRKGRDLLRRQHGEKIIHYQEASPRKVIGFADAEELASHILSMYDEGGFDVAKLVYNRFKSAISQITTVRQIMPFDPAELIAAVEHTSSKGAQGALLEIFEPAREDIIAKLLPRNISVQILSCMHESAAGEQGARMTAMDNATRNAGDMIDRLTLNYNRSRQAYITKELIEIISGAEAL